MKDQIIALYANSLADAARFVADVPDERFAESPYPDAKHPAWVLSHLAVGGGMMAGCLKSDPTDFAGVPEAWMKTSAPGCPVSTERGDYAGKDELLATLRSVHETLTKAVEAASDGDLAAEFPIAEYRDFFPTNGAAVAYMMAFHEPYHLGQLTQWRMAAGFGSPQGQV